MSKHVWGLPVDPANGEPDMRVLDDMHGPCFVGAVYCLNCRKVFCEHCDPEVFNRECEK